MNPFKGYWNNPPTIEMHKVTIGIVVPIVIEVPVNWSEEDIEFYLNDSSLCIGSFKEDIKAILDDKDDCGCGTLFGVGPEEYINLRGEKLWKN